MDLDRDLGELCLDEYRLFFYSSSVGCWGLMRFEFFFNLIFSIFLI